MRTVKLDEIVRQRDPELKAVVEQFAVSGRRSGGLEREGRVPEVKAVTALLAAMPVLARRLPHGLLPQLAGEAFIVSYTRRVRAQLYTKCVPPERECSRGRVRTRTRVKICCIASSAEAAMAMRHGADALGLVASMPSGPGTIDDEMISRVAAGVPPPVATFLLTSKITATKISAHIERTRPTAVQIVSHIEPAESAALAGLQPSVKRVQVIHVESHACLALIPLYSPFVDAFLLDSGRPGAVVPELGGTGRAHDWEISRHFVEQSDLPVFLAGGLTAANVEAAIRTVRPFGVDLCSGVRTGGALDERKLSSFFHALYSADASVYGES